MNNLEELKQSHEKWYTNFKNNFSLLRTEIQSRYMQTPALKTIQLEITKKCNYNCIMCANSEFTSNDKKNDMSWELFTNIIDNLPKSVENINLTSYGEATMHSMYKEMVIYIFEKGYNVNIFTNSIFFDLDLLKCFNQVIFSYDAFTDNLFQEVRGVDNSKVTAENIKKAVSLRNNNNLKTKISINMVCSYINWKDGSKLMDFCEEAGVDEMFITALNNNFYFLNKEKFNELEKDLEKSVDEIDWDYFVESYSLKEYSFPIYLWYPKRDMMGFCRFPFNEMMIDKDGNMMVCCRTNNMLIGNIHNISIEDAFFHPKMKEVRDSHCNQTKHPICSICSDGYPI